jgi:MoaA/NifB/PqqE/SkfB family radical SAM enzyme
MSIIDPIINKLLTTKLLPYPRTVMIDPVNICQLQCPLCSTGRRRLNYDPKIMPLQTFQVVLDKMPFIKKLELYKNGEPFLNPDIFAMTRYACDRNIQVTISTNLSFTKTDDFFEDIVKSGLAKLIVSLDGASQESYARYRKGGNYDLVVSNIRKIIEAKNQLQSKKPEIVWQFLVNKYNEHEIVAAQQISRDLKLELDLQPMGLADDLPDAQLDSTIQERMAQWLPANKQYVSECYRGEYRYPLYRGICAQLFTRLVVTVDGKVLPCCWAEDRNSVFGDLLTESFEKIWNNQHYVNSRMRFLENGFRQNVHTVCSGCVNFGSNPTLKKKLKLLAVAWRDCL